MTAKHDDCGSCGELIQLSLDGRLDSEETRRLEAHLAACPKCAEKLERLRATEAGARSIGLREPPPEYWRAFSGRVTERIEAGAARRPAWGPARALAGLFAAPRLRIAAGIASIGIVVLVGALYLRDRGVMTPPAPAPATVKPTLTAKPPTPEAVPPVEKKLETAAQSVSAPATERKAAPMPAPHVEVAAAPAPKSSEAESLGPLTARAPGEKSKEGAEAFDTVREPKVNVAVSSFSGRGEKRESTVTTTSGTGVIKSAAAGRTVIMLDGASVPVVSPSDTSMSEETLRDVIARWRAHVERNLIDPMNEGGYVQVADAYYLLARLTHDEAVISEGATLVQSYAGRATHPDIKARLLDMKARIESFRAK